MKIKRFLLMAALLFGLLAGFVPAATPAQAGTNGQQVAVYTGNPSCRITRLIVSGTNQNNQHAVWDRSFPSGSQIEVTWNWWWKGTVKIRYELRGKGWHTSYLNVPVTMPSNSYYKDIVYLKTRGC